MTDSSRNFESKVPIMYEWIIKEKNHFKIHSLSFFLIRSSKSNRLHWLQYFIRVFNWKKLCRTLIRSSAQTHSSAQTAFCIFKHDNSSTLSLMSISLKLAITGAEKNVSILEANFLPFLIYLNCKMYFLM